MKIHQSIENFKLEKKSVLTIGTFDGVHLGHLKIIENLVETAKKLNHESVLLTFFPHPRMVIFPDNHGIKLINTLDEKIKLLEKTGLDHIIIQDFTKSFSNLTAEDYIEKIIVEKINASVLVIGYDHRFGKNRTGDIKTLEKYAPIFHYELVEISPRDIEEITISSTKIRNYITNGEIEQANKLLGRSFSLEGKVVQGNQLGREIGFPTANIGNIVDYKLIPADGVYAVKVMINNNIFNGMMNIGFRPTVDGYSHKLEVHIINFNENIYDKNITIEFIAKIRDEQKFSNIESLKTQLAADKVKALALLYSK
ncbi:MAG: bifunctional riboflavin kinase/FAD synthetase [Bacteroidetes bacterium]|nr:bifunctional riboflavin kinase/FAD synthetase [Bacteroidota bacterium]